MPMARTFLALAKSLADINHNLSGTAVVIMTAKRGMSELKQTTIKDTSANLNP